MFKLIKSNIVRRRNQSLLTIAITAITILTFVLVLGVFVTMNHGLSTSRERLGADCIFIPREASADGYQLLYTANPENVYMTTDVMEEIAQLDGVAQVSPQFFSQTLNGGCCDFGVEMRIVGIDPKTDFVVCKQMNISESDELKDDCIVLGGDFTDFVGTQARILDHQFNVIGELYPTGTGMDNTIYMNIDMARKVTTESSMLDVLPDGTSADDLISCVMVKLDEGVDPQKFADYLEVYGKDLDAQCIATSDTVEALEDQLNVTAKVMLGLWISSLVIASLALIGRFNALAKDRKKEIGLLRAIGVHKKQIFGLIIGESCSLAVIGGIAGSIIAGVLMKPVMELLQDAFQLPPSTWDLGLTLLSMLAGILLATLLGFLASVRSAVRSAALEPQTAITQGEVN